MLRNGVVLGGVGEGSDETGIVFEHCWLDFGDRDHRVVLICEVADAVEPVCFVNAAAAAVNHQFFVFIYLVKAGFAGSPDGLAVFPLRGAEIFRPYPFVLLDGAASEPGLEVVAFSTPTHRARVTEIDGDVAEFGRVDDIFAAGLSDNLTTADSAAQDAAAERDALTLSVPGFRMARELPRRCRAAPGNRSALRDPPAKADRCRRGYCPPR